MYLGVEGISQKIPQGINKWEKKGGKMTRPGKGKEGGSVLLTKQPRQKTMNCARKKGKDEVQHWGGNW